MPGGFAMACASTLRQMFWQVRNLQERLEEEHQALLAREADVAALHARVNRLTQLVVRAVRSHALGGQDSLERRHLLRAYWRPPPLHPEVSTG